MSSDEGGLRRWSRRKAEAQQGRGGAAPVFDDDTGKVPAPSEQKDLAAGPDDVAEHPPADLDLPDVESLTADSDFTVFMKEGVPAALRRVALRKLWVSDPVFNVIDEMVEYGEDYTNAAMVVEGMKSAWEPGRGYAKEEPPAEDPVSDSEESSNPDETREVAADTEDASAHAEGEKDVDDDGEDEDAELG